MLLLTQITVLASKQYLEHKIGRQENKTESTWKSHPAQSALQKQHTAISNPATTEGCWRKSKWHVLQGALSQGNQGPRGIWLFLYIWVQGLGKESCNVKAVLTHISWKCPAGSGCVSTHINLGCARLCGSNASSLRAFSRMGLLSDICVG